MDAGSFECRGDGSISVGAKVSEVKEPQMFRRFTQIKAISTSSFQRF